MRICVLGSGSRGNSTLVESGDTRILIDNGFSGKEIRRRLRLIDRDADTIDALLLTHEHNDHIGGAGVLSRQAAVPLCANGPTFREAGPRLGKVRGRLEFGTGEPFVVGCLEIHPFAVSHDTVEPVGFVISDGRYRFGYCTDTGKMTTLIEHHLRECDALVLESNHDPEMLREGPYPPYLQQRVRSNRGHLANEDAGRFLARLASRRLRHVILAHLSETNNLPELALSCTLKHLDGHGERIGVIAACQDVPTPCIDLSFETA
ncbi:MAG: MBL fold metallo-hydrolase [Desulfobulbaceae bacterium]